MNNKETDELADQLTVLLDKESIRELVQAYCNAADRHDHEKMRSLYHGIPKRKSQVCRFIFQPAAHSKDF